MKSKGRSAPVGTLLDDEFDSGFDIDAETENLKFYDDPAARMGDLAGGVSEVASSRRRRKTTPVDDPETVTVPDDEPPGWAEP